MKYKNRSAAGKILADHLQHYANQKDVIVLALPRGGVPVGYEIAQRLHAPLDVFIVRKLGVPGHRELAMGALAMGNIKFFNRDIIEALNIHEEEIAETIKSESMELKRRQLAYRGTEQMPDIEGKNVILVDDGIATGATIRAAITALRQLLPAKIIVAVPVAQNDFCKTLESIVDELICPMRPIQLGAVGAWYELFDQTEDDEVRTLLQA